MRTHGHTAIIAAAVLGLAASPGAAAPEQKNNPADKKLCRWIEARTGSQIRERVCLTADQWRKVEEQLAW